MIGSYVFVDNVKIWNNILDMSQYKRKVILLDSEFKSIINPTLFIFYRLIIFNFFTFKLFIYI